MNKKKPLNAAEQLREAQRPCTCHPDDAPIPCQHKYALGECIAALPIPADPPDPVRAAMMEALREISDSIVGDCPSSLAHLTDAEWAMRRVGDIRRIARAALAAAGETP